MAPPTRPRIVIGLDVGKSAHWACVVTREGELLASGPIPNREDAIDGLYAQYPGALVVVDQVRNIGSLALSRAKLTEIPRAYLPGLAAHGAPKLFAGDAKTDERDAMVISIDIADFADHDRLASYCGLAPRNKQSASISSVSASRQGNKRLKNLLIFSCSCLTRSRNQWGRILRALPRQGHAARQGAESRGEGAAQSDLHDHEGTRFRTQPNSRRRSQARQGLRQHYRKRPSKGRIPLDRTIGTPPSQCA